MSIVRCGLMAAAALWLAAAAPASAQAVDYGSAANRVVVNDLSLADWKTIVADLGWTLEVQQTDAGEIGGMVRLPDGLNFLLTGYGCEAAGGVLRCTGFDLVFLHADPPAGALDQINLDGDTRLARVVVGNQLAIFRSEDARRGVTRGHVLATLDSYAESLREDVVRLAGAMK